MGKRVGCIHNKKKSCNGCAKRRSRERHPMRYAYQTLKDNCKRRKGIGFFELTFEEFKQYAIETDYLVGKGITKTSYHIDCIDPTMGYFIGNIRPLQNSHNAKKGKKVLHYEWNEEEGRMVATVVNNTNTISDEENESIPFPHPKHKT